MLFNSYEFVFVLLPVSFFVYFYLNKKKIVIASKIWLVFVSLFFYGWWNIAYLPLILISISFNYFISQRMNEFDGAKRQYLSKKTLFQIGLVFNISLLGYFKYMDFFIQNINLAVGSEIPLLYLALPLAISFFTLQQIAYLVDSYEGLVKEKNFLNYTIFVVFFPQLIAGPIVHHKEMMPQFSGVRYKVKNYKNIVMGLFIFSIGLFKKAIIADTLAVWATNGFDNVETIHFIMAWFVSLSYTFQLYFDFSGYTDMAMGAALLFNIRLPQNFNSPYKATGMIDFWKRWHITLTNFITTYIYMPIVRSFEKLTFHKAMLTTIVTFLIAGLWHGASWTFVVFGGLNGVGIAANHYWKKKTKFKLNRILAWFLTFNFVNITFVFFRAREWDDAIKILNGMSGRSGFTLPGHLANIIETKLPFLAQYNIQYDESIHNIGITPFTPFWVLFVIIVVCYKQNSIELMDSIKINYHTAIYAGFLFAWAALSLSNVSEFLYFNF
ncbi:MAG: membrane-bound O-acyltransferase family protein [Robiginitomaculum sp.]|nr:MAG: membrane-bound O-acyltransferase family protein [Robiginitomaculum sp.]